MTESAALMAVKVIGLVVAGIGFAVWQFRDVASAQAQSKSKTRHSDVDVGRAEIPTKESASDQQR